MSTTNAARCTACGNTLQGQSWHGPNGAQRCYRCHHLEYSISPDEHDRLEMGRLRAEVSRLTEENQRLRQALSGPPQEPSEEALRVAQDEANKLPGTGLSPFPNSVAKIVRAAYRAQFASEELDFISGNPDFDEDARRSLNGYQQTLTEILHAVQPECPAYPGIANSCHYDACDCFAALELEKRIRAQFARSGEETPE